MHECDCYKQGVEAGSASEFGRLQRAVEDREETIRNLAGRLRVINELARTQEPLGVITVIESLSRSEVPKDYRRGACADPECCP